MSARSLKNSAVIALNTPLHLTEDELENPVSVLQDFADTLELDYLRGALFNMFTAIMLVSDEGLDDEYSRADYLFCFKEMQRAIEAGHWIGRNALNTARDKRAEG